MNKYLILVSMSLLLVLISLSLVIDQAVAQSASSAGNAKSVGNGPVTQIPGQQGSLHATMNTAAAFRKSQGMMQYTTSDDRWAAAIRTADNRADAIRHGKGQGGAK
jgi:hypothetical protein